MEIAYKRHVNGLPPIPLSLSINGNDSVNKVASFETDSTTQNHQVPQSRNQDTKKQKRILASRQYSQKYRLKQVHYILQLETEVKALQAEVLITTPRIKYIDRQNSLLRAENGSMKKKLSAFSGELTFKKAQYEELKREREVLKRLYKQQQLPELVKTKPDQNYELGFNLFEEPRAGMSPQMLDRITNPFGPGQI